MHRPRAASAAILLLAWSVAACGTPRPSLRPGLEFRWAERVLFGTEMGDERDVVVRWVAPVRYVVVGADPRCRSAVVRAFAQLQEVLVDVHPLELAFAGDGDARVGADGHVTLFFTAPRDAAELAERHGGHAPSSDADGWFTITWNGDHELTHAIVFVDPELDDVWLAHTVLEEMYQVLGASDDSPMLPESVVCEGAGVVGAADRLARVDRELLRLLYAELRPGDLVGDLAAAMERSWDFGERQTP